MKRPFCFPLFSMTSPVTVMGSQKMRSPSWVGPESTEPKVAWLNLAAMSGGMVRSRWMR